LAKAIANTTINTGTIHAKITLEDGFFKDRSEGVLFSD
jgi:hypothetical protein